MDNPRQPRYLSAVFLGSTAFIFLNFGLPIRADDLGIDAFGIGVMYAVFTGTMLLVRPLVGWCLDRYGRRWFFTFAFAFYAASMFAFARSVDIFDFYLARFLQGIGASLMWVSARTIIADLHEADSRGMEMGQLTVVSVRGSMLGAIYGFTLIGMMPMSEAWVLAFGGYAVMALFGWVWSLFAVVETKVGSEATRMPAIVWTADLRKALTVVFLSAFAAALIEPVYLIYLKHKFDLQLYELALAFLPAGLVFAVLPRYAGAWSDRLGRATLIALGVTLAGCVSIALPFWPSIYLVALSYMFFTAGWALASPAEEALVADLAPAELRGTIIGTKEAAAGIGAALGPMVGGLIYDHWSQPLAFVCNGLILLCTALVVRHWFGGGKRVSASAPGA